MDDRGKLTYSELTEILCILAIKMQREEENIAFLIDQMLKSKMMTIQAINKFTSSKKWQAKEIRQMQEQLDGFLDYYSRSLKEKKDKPEGIIPL